MDEAATNRSKRALRCFIAAWMAPSTSDHASMKGHYRAQTYSIPSNNSFMKYSLVTKTMFMSLLLPLRMEGRQ